MKHLLKLWDLTGQEIIDILNLADQLKYEQKNGESPLKESICSSRRKDEEHEITFVLESRNR